MKKRIQVLGLCRFSVPSFGAFQTTHESIEARRDMLYEPHRLEARFTWFEYVLLPSLREQTDPDFKLIVLLGKDFPAPWLQRMKSLTAKIPQIVLEFAAPWKHRAICAKAMASHVEKGVFAVAQFRLDDDDAVAVDFVEQLRADVVLQADLFRRDRLMALDYARGVVLRETKAGVQVEPVLARYWTPALAVVTRPDTEKFILDFRHHTLWRDMASVIFVDKAMFVRGAHDSNDSAIPNQEPAYSFPFDNPAAFLQTRFCIDLAEFDASLKELRSLT